MKHPRDLARARVPNLRKPTATDGAAIWELIRSCKPLDENSMYCNVIQCDHFADTCVVAELEGKAVGWISAYVMPNDPETLFVWQVAVAEDARGLGLGGRMLQEILGRKACDGVQRIQTTITSDNDASWALFRKFGKLQGSQLDAEPYYKQAAHFQKRHKTENLVTIPLAQSFAKAA
ncbi:diaminobutyrate acetyltransferase [Cognatishimia sp. F0-27]|uniref:diaminobutyrate acetyltransferase n=1 Tax=Cognatishimia sp. F0-27 TaxID=2816855 RepID=UPI001D0CB4B4|nr:diaminobutyrate acetyltransferase [Cognatishimia sp. F0-27]MCC1493077.1 diaminobutyrate acetyltransferase [Cognatishimia sp. F0-27]